MSKLALVIIITHWVCIYGYGLLASYLEDYHTRHGRPPKPPIGER